jgi:hypothetical protein
MEASQPLAGADIEAGQREQRHADAQHQDFEHGISL